MWKLIVGLASLYTLMPLAALAQHEGHDHSQHAEGVAPSSYANTGAPAHYGEVAQPASPSRDSASGLAPRGQVTCPVSGRPVDPSISKMYECQKVFFCSEHCARAFDLSPLNGLARVYNQLYPQRVQVTCPVMGGEVDPSVSIQYQGQKMSFCCGDCDGKFRQDPARYAAKLDAAYTQQVHCPVDGKAISPKFSTEGKGGKTYFCSENCAEKFKSDPQYAPAALLAVGVLGFGPTTADDIVMCAVTSQLGRRGKMQSLVYTDTLYFVHSPECVEQFKKDPERYVIRIHEEMKPPAPPQARRPVFVQPSASSSTNSAYGASHAGHGATSSYLAPNQGGGYVAPSHSGHYGDSGYGAPQGGHAGHGGGGGGHSGGCCN